MIPFVKSEHKVWPVHGREYDIDSGSFEPSGYIHESGMSRKDRRAMWGFLSSRQGRMEVRRIKRGRILARMENKRKLRVAVKAEQFLKLTQWRVDNGRVA